MIATVRSPTGEVLERVERRTAARAWLSVQGAAGYLRSSGELVLRWPAGTTVEIEGEVGVRRLRADGTWEVAPPAEQVAPAGASPSGTWEITE